MPRVTKKLEYLDRMLKQLDSATFLIGMYRKVAEGLDHDISRHVGVFWDPLLMETRNNPREDATEPPYEPHLYSSLCSQLEQYDSGITAFILSELKSSRQDYLRARKNWQLADGSMDLTEAHLIYPSEDTVWARDFKPQS